jgi:deoxyribose-phosphate aldolase
MDYTYEAIAKMIDHSLLNPAMKQDELEAGCKLALEYDVASVCILPYYLARCSQILEGSRVRASTTVGFPHGGHTTQIKVAEAKQALEDGGEELDVVCNISKVLSGDFAYVKAELHALTQVIHDRGQKIKVIFENSYLDEKQKIALCEICGEIGADWAKTSTGYSSGGATIDDLKLMRAHCPAHVQIKAAGGVRDLDGLLAVRAVGATRCGASRTRDILDECRRRLSR